MVRTKLIIPEFLPNRLFVLLMIIMLVLLPIPSLCDNHRINRKVEAYVLNKLEGHDIVFLGTSHKKPAILKFIADLIPLLKEAGVTRIGLEIPTDQQVNLDTFMNTGAGLMDIYVHPQ